ncbi:TPA: c1 repressor inactivator [Escherichia coli]|nr:c1 repressor inactivator [Escherichia coli]EFN5155057.1 c1 repressor inactivator [Escherichia coli]ELN1463310.1 c1 repressor inactivator [Escherichia coli]ELZ1169831.1 c1 repressor inactivator [Escherichia coli]
MAFIQPTIGDVRHCSNALSVDPAETDAARAIAEHYSKISNQEYRITQDDLDDLDDLTDTIEYLMATNQLDSQ